MLAELLRLLDLFEENGVRAVPLKGPVLAESLYGNVALRYFKDLDILIDPADLPKVKQLLTAVPYSPGEEPVGVQEAAWIRACHEYNFHRDDGAFRLEIHHRCLPRTLPYSRTLADLKEELEPVTAGGRSVQTLSPESLLLFLCVHGGIHRWHRLKWICDVAELIGGRPIDWRKVFSQAVAAGAERMLLLGLSLASGLMGAELPEEIRQRISADRVLPSLVRKVRQKLFLEGNDPPGNVENFFFHYAMQERLRDRIRYAWRRAMVPTQPDWMFLRLPAPFFPLYTLLRPLRLAKQYGIDLLRHALQRTPRGP